MERRDFLTALSASAMASTMGSFGGFARAQTAPTADYKALVCIFLQGGNDANNMVIPASAAGYAGYAGVRTPASGLNLPLADLVTFRSGNMTEPLGLHPVMSALRPVAESGKLAVLANTGTMLAPISKAEYLAYKDRPDNLFSHSDQVAQWQSVISNEPSRLGWGGRLADAIAPMNAGVNFPAGTSVSGNTLYLAGSSQSSLTLPATGAFTLNGFGTSTAQTTRLAALNQLLSLQNDNMLAKAASDEIAQAIALSAKVNPIITSTTSPVVSLFTTAGNPLAAQLLQVAKLIEARAAIGLKRQIFFVSLGGFDTHTNQIATQSDLLGDVGNAMRSFYDATVSLGVANNVTTFTMSDFGRTFKPAAGGSPGSDHGWGSHHLIMGGAVKGGLYGKMPTLELSGPDDVSKEGRWLPTTAVDQYVGTLASWFGIPAADLAKVAPNIGKFATKNLGFFA
jgi:uncharacterized protein (DUF1501 family)